MKEKEQIRAEIERLKEETAIGICEYDKGEENGRMEVLTSLLSFIDSLPEEQKIEASYEIRFDPTNGFDLGSVNVYRDGNLVAQRPEQWKWIDPKYEYPLCLTREMDEYGDWHYSLSSGKISETCQYISLAELEGLPEEPVDVDAAMKELDEKIKLTKEHGSWEGVDVDKFMDEVRGRESDDLEEAAEEFATETFPLSDETYTDYSSKAGFIAGAKWQKERMIKAGVDADVFDLGHGFLDVELLSEHFQNALKGCKGGDKVKLIIVKL